MKNELNQISFWTFYTDGALLSQATATADSEAQEEAKNKYKANETKKKRHTGALDAE